jgi:hypothetical protein
VGRAEPANNEARRVVQVRHDDHHVTRPGQRCQGFPPGSPIGDDADRDVAINPAVDQSVLQTDDFSDCGEHTRGFATG